MGGDTRQSSAASGSAVTQQRMASTYVSVTHTLIYVGEAFQIFWHMRVYAVLYAEAILFLDMFKIVQGMWVYEGCSIYNETVLITFTFYKVQRHKYNKH